MRHCFILFFTLNLLINLNGQDINGSLYKSNCITFRNSVYVMGYEDNSGGLAFKIIRYSSKLEKIAETIKPLGKHKPADLYPPAIDTTHGYLSITIQQTSNEKTADLLRYTENLKVLAYIEKAEITHINSFAAFDEEKIYYKDQLFVVRPARDSIGKFYFYRYDLKDSTKLFSYDLSWQFNFDKHNYHRIHPVYVNDKNIYLYVICLDGDKKGQWLLTLNTEDGTLGKAIKLNKNDNEFCIASKTIVYGQNEDIALSGLKYPSAGVDLKTGKFNMNYQASKTINTFFLQLDSSGEIKNRLDNFIPVPNEILKEKEMKELLFRCNTLDKVVNGFNLNYECLYKGEDGIYRTYGFLLCNLVLTIENLLKPENNAFLSCYRNEKNLPTGKIGNPHCKETANQYDNDKAQNGDRLFYKNAFVRNFTEAGIEITPAKKAAYILSFFNDKKTSTLEIYKNIMKNYVWETSSLKSLNDNSHYNLFNLGANKFLIFNSSKDEKMYNLGVVEF